ncbi:hypothetical protein BJY01DRAFT_256242 [Aspergillus pseudoustus]|uniref:Uncharacterized protein n=1 Tax=Aspergillus pseudoustus TaxID=1810923 RepID=A0ABR4ICT3_9EURO
MLTEYNCCPPVADIAKILDLANIPNLLWGWWVVACHGKLIQTPDIDFIIADDEIEAAAQALEKASQDYTRCTNA